jgi:hypothetical protein
MDALGVFVLLALAVAAIVCAVMYQRNKPGGRSRPSTWRPPPRPGTGSRPGPPSRPAVRTTGSRVRIVSTRPPHGAAPPRVPGSVGTGRLRSVGRSREGCPYCGAGLDPGEPFVSCTYGHTHHRECLQAAGGRCAQPHCPGTAG